MQTLAAAGEHFVRIRLMAYVPDQPVMGGVVDVVQRDGEFDRAKTRGEVAPARADTLNQELAHLIRQLRQLGKSESAYILRTIDGVQEGVLRGGHSAKCTPRPVWLRNLMRGWRCEAR